MRKSKIKRKCNCTTICATGSRDCQCAKEDLLRDVMHEALSKKQAPTLKEQIEAVKLEAGKKVYTQKHHSRLSAACTTLIAIARIGEKKILLFNDLIERNEDFLKEFEHSSEDALSLHSHIGRIRSILNKMK